MYFAYGSNLLTTRIRQPDRAPSARRLALGWLEGHELRFDKQGRDGSGKCHPLPASEGVQVHGSLFEVGDAELQALDRVEGVGMGYVRQRVEVRTDDGILSAWSYLAQDGHVVPLLEPFDWYRDLVLAGARESGLPRTYLSLIGATPARRDPDSERAARMRRLLRALR